MFRIDRAVFICMRRDAMIRNRSESRSRGDPRSNRGWNLSDPCFFLRIPSARGESNPQRQMERKKEKCAGETNNNGGGGNSTRVARLATGGVEGPFRVNYSKGGAFLLPLGLRAKPPRLLTPQLFTLSKPRLFHHLKILPISWKAIVNQACPAITR